ncbi:2'-5' RNA ligase family protein [Aureimonas sp. Leaf324]|uniref:2'-5' RNA ligase family protein n=1 Tax=Aureimonas sp. Leaf324 TaxID=1736336 RepID=UPI0006F22C6B|nr:2'-5' RNA ligase family protein [Aureimonas sp. Leaf324]KQQ91301.1 phosphoesterase HXTX [Aureimonas sp. Leaf324]
MDIDPLILTLRFDAASFERFDAMRRRYFPPARNMLPAHLTLFHKLPGERLPAIHRDLAALAGETPPLQLIAQGIRFLGYGSAYEIRCDALKSLRARLAERWAGDLTRQDAAGFAPHVTIQNKAPARDAKALCADLKAAFSPFEAEGTGLLLWHYRGGPWELAGEYGFVGRL